MVDSRPAEPRSTTAAVRTNDLTSCSGGELAELIRNHEVSSQRVVEAFVERIERVDPQLNALVVPRLDQARQEAIDADQRQAAGQPLGPLHGVPVTIKECFDVAGLPTTIGLKQRAGAPVAEDGVLVQRLRQAGAIVLGKTNVPQLMLLHETDNPVYGRTNNPWNLDRTPGGSSGGEAAIIAARGSPWGLGSDMGGSLRVPAHFCGLHTLKPTSDRLPRRGVLAALSGMRAIQFQPGPLAKTVADLDRLMQVLIGGAPSGHYDCPPVPWPDYRKFTLAGTKIGVWEDDPFFPVVPSIRRVVQQAAEALKPLGVEIVPFQPPDLEQALLLYLCTVAADGGADVRRLAQGSPLDGRIRRMLNVGRLPGLLRPAASGLLQMVGQRRASRMIAHATRCSTDHLWQASARIDDYRQAFSRQWTDQGLSAVLAPCHALPALVHGTAGDLLDAACYCLLPNLLGVPAGSVALSRVRADEVRDRPASKDLLEKYAAPAERDSAGLPLGVQVFAPHWREDVVLAVMSALEAAHRNQDDYPPNFVVPVPSGA